MSKVNFGNVNDIGGQTVISGIASGFDTKAIIDGLKAAKEIPIKQLEDTISINDKKNKAFHDFKEKVEIFQEAANFLRNVPSMDKTLNSFNGRKVVMTTDCSQPIDNYIDVFADKGSDLANYSLQVISIAKAHARQSQTFTSQTTSVTEAAGGITSGLFSEGIFQINGIDVALKAGDSLIEIKSAINAVSSSSGVTASIVQVSATDYRLVLRSNNTGIANSINITDASNVVSDVTFSNLQTPADATFNLNGIPITRSSNIISDVIQNVTFTLKQPTDAGKYGYLSINNDVEATKLAIKNFVGAYNDVALFVSKQQELDEDFKYKESAVLGNDSTLRLISSKIMTEMSSYVKGITSSFITIGEVGLAFIEYEGDDENPHTNNILRIDDAILDNVLATQYENVRRVFEFDFRSSSKTIANTGRTNALNTTAFSLDIDTSRAAGDQVRVTYHNGVTNVTINADYDGTTTSGAITGQKNTVLDGLSMIYVGDGTDNVSVTLTQGIADKLYNYLKDISKPGGDIELAIKSINDINTKYAEEVKKKKSDLDDYVEKLKSQFGRVEQMISSFNSTIMFLQAQTNASNNK
ncbi:MAG: flagellar filament capping protein FliD [Alphaproteobacteria bacterium]|nr:flagellar filament capping protein FliD [Alphaproteobacteria bacterium]OJV13887.1 MAG: hypothetical protein BGO27_08330 [Alphaproteobacteria bacterium 33-17]